MEQNNPLFIAFQQGYARRNSNNFSRDWDEFKTNHADLFQPPSPAKPSVNGELLGFLEIEIEKANKNGKDCNLKDGDLNRAQAWYSAAEAFSIVKNKITELLNTSHSHESSIINCPSCNTVWDLSRHNSCQCGAALATKASPAKAEQEGPTQASLMLDELCELVFNDRLYGTSAGVSGRPHDPDPEISKVKRKILDLISTTPPVKEAASFKLKELSPEEQAVLNKTTERLFSQVPTTLEAVKEAGQPSESEKDFEDLLEAELNKLPYTKHVDDGQYNDGQCAGFELGARWAQSRQQPAGESGKKEREIVFAEWIREQNYKPYAGWWYLNGNNFANQPISEQGLYDLWQQSQNNKP